MLVEGVLLEPLLTGHISQVGNHRTREIERLRLTIEHHLGRVGILQRGETILHLEGLHKRGDVGCGVVEAVLQGLKLCRLNEGLVTLHIDHHIILHTLLAVGLPATVRAAAVLRGGHLHLAAKGLYSFVDALVVRSNHGVVQDANDLLIDALNHRFAPQHSQRLARKTGGGVARRNDGYKFHTYYLRARLNTSSLVLT